VTMICFAYDIPFPECIYTHIDIYCCIIPPQLPLVSPASDAMIVGVGAVLVLCWCCAGAGAGAGAGIDIDIGTRAVREQPSRRRAALVTNR
jgi:hypothetical protein